MMETAVDTKELIPFVVPTHLPGFGGWGNGYVAIPEGHPCYGMDYDAIHDKYEIDVHWGLTFADKSHLYQPEETKGMWIVGFDTLHLNDSEENWPDAESVMMEAGKLKAQLTTLTLTEKGKEQNLCAAAPEMYAVLKNLFNGLSGLTVAEGTTIKLALSVDEVNKALAILAKVNK